LLLSVGSDLVKVSNAGMLDYFTIVIITCHLSLATPAHGCQLDWKKKAWSIEEPNLSSPLRQCLIEQFSQTSISQELVVP
jgi:hypothetical protein